MSYSEFDIKKVRDAADIRDFIPGIQQIGARFYAKCPTCGADGKHGMLVTQNARKSIAKCFKCGFSIGGAFKAVEHYNNVKFPESLEIVARHYGIPIETEEEKEKKFIMQKKSDMKGSFCEAQLKASGLTLDDVTALVNGPDGKPSRMPVFRKGATGPNGLIEYDSDEMLVFYYDLYGNLMQYTSARGALRPYVRVRWSNPDIHLSPEGRPIKYQSPKGADVRFYIPDYIRKAFREGKEIDTLIIQEGEKKAEKACKHGIASLGIQGIYNIGNKDSGLIQDLQYIVQKCKVKNVVLLFDSDWDNLHRSLEAGDDIDQRPNQFAKAAVKFKKYVETLHTKGASVDVWFGHINHNEHDEKGIDDLLTGSLAGKEHELLSDMENTMLTHNGLGTYADFHKISSLTDFQIMDFWHLRDRDEFFRVHEAEIKPLLNFRFAKINYRRTKEGTLEKADTQGSDKEFWSSHYNDKDKLIIEFDHLAAFSFLEANGFYRIAKRELGELDYEFIKVKNGIVKSVGPHTIRDFAYRYALQNCKSRPVLNYIADKLGSLLGNDRLERLEIIDDNFDIFDPLAQTRYYRNTQIRISATSIETGPIMGMVWKQNVIDRTFRRTQIFSEIIRNGPDDYEFALTDDGKNCEFLRYLINTCNFWKDEKITEKEERQFNQHFFAKATAIGYLLTDYKYASEKKAVIAVDGKMSKVGTSMGRSGKSLVGDAISRIISQEVIDGKNLKNDDEYMYSTVTYRTRNIMIDDIRERFDFQKLFQAISGPLAVNPKTLARFTIEFARSPKFLITTNHSIKEDSQSARDRMAYISFSDWYNTYNTPRMEFGHDFFEEWDEYQWTLFDNLMAEFVMIYLRSRLECWTKSGCGVVPPPMEGIEARHLRQKMGESYYEWAEAYFDPTGPNLNNRIKREDMYAAFIIENPGQKMFVPAAAFREKLIAYCEFRGLHLNPQRTDSKGRTFTQYMTDRPIQPFEGTRDLSGGKEYFTVSTEEFARQCQI